ncbi:hypothetical protein ABMC88_17265, partial [Sulfitobacter sp. HNIBRBA2951]|uniref:hypothetical protein n=1 Tax=Sulfitobacter aquimarinus TaxID=3158557 RepID=UPI0032DE6B85
MLFRSFLFAAFVPIIVLFQPVPVIAQSCYGGDPEVWRIDHTFVPGQFDTPDAACEAGLNLASPGGAEYVGYELNPTYGNHSNLQTGMALKCNYITTTVSTGDEPTPTTLDGRIACDIDGDESTPSVSGFCKPKKGDSFCSPSASCGCNLGLQDGVGNSPGGMSSSQLGTGRAGINPSESTVGNPILIADGLKVERAFDWASKKDNRFRFDRVFSSVNTEFRITGFQEIGSNWSTSWSYIQTSASGHLWDRNHFVHLPGGKKVGFYLGYGSNANYEPLRSDEPYVLYDDPAGSSDRFFEDGSGYTIQFSLFAGHATTNTYYFERFPTKITWPDGYALDFDRDTSGRILAVNDNKGQRAEYTWEINPDGDRRLDVLEQVTIDTEYNGTTFVPQIAIDYSFLPQSSSIYGRILEQSTVRELASGRIFSNQSYDYFKSSDPDSDIVFPNQLKTVFDGRLTDAAEPLAYANFTYQSDQLCGNINNTVNATSTSHSEGSDAFGLSVITPVSAAGPPPAKLVTNSLGKETVYNYDFIAGIMRPTSIEGVATSSCLATTKLLGYTPDPANTDAPLGYVYERVQKNGSVTRF